MEIKWKIEMYKADPKKAYEEISQLENITPQAVVNLARDKKSVIHNDFEWNDEIAGEKYRVMQAGKMIRSFVFEPTVKEHAPLRALQITTEKNTYKPIEFFAKNEDEYQSLLARAKKELYAIKDRQSGIDKAEQVFRLVCRVRYVIYGNELFSGTNFKYYSTCRI